MSFNLVLLGPPAAGKGTQSKRIAATYGIPHISTGQLLRNNKHMETEHGTPADYIDEGRLVPDEMIIDILQERLMEDDAQDGFILDGFPRNLAQAEALEEITELDAVIYLRVSEDNIIERITGRRTCTGCGKTYHVDHNPPPEDGRCEDCGAKLVQREDDTEDVIQERLQQYHEQTHPLIDHYREKNILIEIDGNPDIETVWQQVQAALDDMAP